ncbi:MAG: RNase adapter RapZ [Oscillospiraceae bacterium]|nr:RNase adapter RapZ [Oscillospiraceae bacterium]
MEILVITGLSGAGKSRAAKYLEDMGYYTIDNMPAEHISHFAAFCIERGGRFDRVALVSDIRGGSDGFPSLLRTVEKLREKGVNCRLLVLAADTDTIIRRYKETRRMHPLMKRGDTIEDAARQEEELLRPLREHADFVIDTTQMPSSKLRSELFSLFGDRSQLNKLTVSVVSFGYKHGIPQESDLVFDVRFMPNPFYIPEMRDLTGLDSQVRDYVFSFEQTNEFVNRLEELLKFLLPRYSEEGKTMLVISVGCTGGRHRSVAIARELAERISRLGYPTAENHRDMTRRDMTHG